MVVYWFVSSVLQLLVNGSKHSSIKLVLLFLYLIFSTNKGLIKSNKYWALYWLLVSLLWPSSILRIPTSQIVVYRRVLNFDIIKRLFWKLMNSSYIVLRMQRYHNIRWYISYLFVTRLTDKVIRKKKTKQKLPQGLYLL